jgi:hypothetical protein
VTARTRTLAAFIPLLVLWWAASTAAHAQELPIRGEIPPQGGLAILIVEAETNASELTSALLGQGCRPISIFITVGGEFVGYVPGAPDFVNAGFPGELAAGTGFITRCVAPPQHAERTNQCANEDIGYTIGYPADWHANTNTVVGPCIAFSIGPVVVPPATDFIAPIMIGRNPHSLEEAIGHLTPMFYTVLWQQETQILGRDAVRVETRTTGEGLLDAGVDQYAYYIRLDEESTLTLTVTEARPLDYISTKVILDAMIGTLEIGAGTP